MTLTTTEDIHSRSPDGGRVRGDRVAEKRDDAGKLTKAGAMMDSAFAPFLEAKIAISVVLPFHIQTTKTMAQSTHDASLLPPKDRKIRSRALSSGVRPKLSIATLSRSATATSQPDYLATASTADSASSSKEQSSDSLNSPVFIPPPLKSPRNLSPIISGRLAAIQNMVPVLVARAIDLWRVLRSGPSSKLSADLFATPDSSPRSSTDTDYILPLSSSPRKASFDHAALSPPQSASLFRIAAFPPVSHPITP